MQLIQIRNNTVTLEPQTASAIAEYERAMKVLKAKEDELKKAILAEMEHKGIIKLDTPEVTITYIASSDRETFDTKKFRNDHSDLYDEYVRISPVKSSIRIKVKNE